MQTQRSEILTGGNDPAFGVFDGEGDEKVCRQGVNGWAVGGEEAGDDAHDGAALHDTIEREVLPAWADRARWLPMMGASIEVAEQHFTSDRMVSEYVERLYRDVEAEPVPRGADRRARKA